MARFDARNFGATLVYSYLVVAFLAFIASQFDLPTFRIGFGLLLIIVSVGISIILTGIQDIKIKKNNFSRNPKL